MKKRSKKLLAIFGVIILLIIVFALTFNNGVLLKQLTGQTVIYREEKTITKVIDGDTFLIDGGKSVRMLGIDADERGYPCYYPAKDELEALILGKKVYLEREKEDKDIYGRYLRYVFLEEENINLKLVREGFVVARTNPEDKYGDLIVAAENDAKTNGIGCKWSNTNWLPGSNIDDGNLNWQKLVGQAIAACDSGEFVGKEVIIQGKVIDVYKSASNTIFMNFEKPYPNSCFTAVVFKSDLSNFQNFEQYLNKVVRVQGKVKEYKGKPEVILDSEEQIEIGQN